MFMRCYQIFSPSGRGIPWVIITQIEIGCPIHGYFMQKPDAHKTSGCSAFANEGLEGKYSEKYFARNPKKKENCRRFVLNLLWFWWRAFYKVGITCLSVVRRFSGILSKKWHTVAEVELTPYEAYQRERKILDPCNSFAYRPALLGQNPRSISLGPTEYFSDDFPVSSVIDPFSDSKLVWCRSECKCRLSARYQFIYHFLSWSFWCDKESCSVSLYISAPH